MVRNDDCISYCDVVPFEIPLMPVNDGSIFEKESVYLDLTLTASSETRSGYQRVHKENKRQGEEYGGTGLRMLQCLVNRQPIHHIKYPAVIYYLSSENE